MTIMDSIRRAFLSRGTSDQAAGGTVGTQLGVGQVEAIESQEFPPEEFGSDEQEESD